MMNKEETDKFIENMFRRGSWLGLPTSVYIGTEKVITKNEIDAAKKECIQELEKQISKLKEDAIKDADRIKARDFALKEVRASKETLAAENWDLIERLKGMDLNAEFRAATLAWKNMLKQVGAKNEELKGEIKYATKQAKIAENILNNIIEEQRDTIIGYSDVVKDLTKKLKAVESVWQTRIQEVEKNAIRRITELQERNSALDKAYITQKNRAEMWKTKYWNKEEIIFRGEI